MHCTVFVIVILSVCPSVTLVHCVDMVRPTIMISSPYGSPIILVSGESQNSKGVTPSEGTEFISCAALQLQAYDLPTSVANRAAPVSLFIIRVLYRVSSKIRNELQHTVITRRSKLC